MRRIISIIFSGVLIFALGSCGTAEDTAEVGTETSQNEITELVDQGYYCSMSSADDTQWKGVFQTVESNDSIIAVTADMTAEQYEAYNSIEFDDPDMETKQMEILGSLANVTVTDITDMIPTQDELDAYIGQTIRDLEDAGFENTGWSGDADTGYTFFYDGPVYCCIITPTDDTVIEDMDDYSVNDIRALEIASVEFSNLSGAILEQF